MILEANMAKKLLTLIIFAMTFLCANAFADDDEKKGTHLNLSVSESTEVEEDLLIVNLRFETEGKTSQDVQKEINKKMESALAEVKKQSKISVSTENYSVYQYNPRTHKGEKSQTIWKGGQSIQLKGNNFMEILKTTGILQSMGLAVNGLSYVVSPELSEETRDSLMEKSVEKLLNKAKRVAKVLGKDDIKVLNINVDSNSYYPSPILMRSSDMMVKNIGAESVPVASPGQSRISTTVSATILIKD